MRVLETGTVPCLESDTSITADTVGDIRFTLASVINDSVGKVPDRSCDE